MNTASCAFSTWPILSLLILEITPWGGFIYFLSHLRSEASRLSGSGHWMLKLAGLVRGWAGMQSHASWVWCPTLNHGGSSCIVKWTQRDTELCLNYDFNYHWGFITKMFFSPYAVVWIFVNGGEACAAFMSFARFAHTVSVGHTELTVLIIWILIGIFGNWQMCLQSLLL